MLCTILNIFSKTDPAQELLLSSPVDKAYHVNIMFGVKYLI
jgi:hypothetical protein